MSMWLTALLHVLACVGIMLLNGSMLIYMLRKVLGYMHLRYGPTELGPGGILQLIPDIVKLLVKEDRPLNKSDKWIYRLAPFIVFVPALMAYAAIPFSNTLVAANLDLGLLMLLAFLSVIPLGVFAAGWGSYNKFSLIGAMRGIGGAVTYEIPLLLSALAPVILAGSLNLVDIVNAQVNSFWYWLPCLPSMVLFFIGALMETNQTPFDMSEAEGELVGGFATEYSAMRFGFMYLAEFSNLFIMAALMVTLFFGGWTLPFISPDKMGAFGPLVFVIKSYLVIFLFMFVRGTYSRFRVDQYTAFGWKKLMPFALVWTMVFAFAVKAFQMWGGGA